MFKDPNLELLLTNLSKRALKFLKPQVQKNQTILQSNNILNQFQKNLLKKSIMFLFKIPKTIHSFFDELLAEIISKAVNKIQIQN